MSRKETGLRVYDKAPHQLAAGEYGKWSNDGAWYAVPPDTDLAANLTAHQITEHDDGTISVTPSIEVSNGRDRWHGHLKHGVFEEC